MAGDELLLKLTTPQVATILVKMKLKPLRQAVAGNSSSENVAMLLCEKLADSPKLVRMMEVANIDFERMAQLLQNAR